MKQDNCICWMRDGTHKKWCDAAPAPLTGEDVNFLQVGRMVKCGHCKPELYSKNQECQCVCHDDDPNQLPAPRTGERYENFLEHIVVEWEEQGRTEEQAYGVRNFLAGLGGRAIREMLASSIAEVTDSV